MHLFFAQKEGTLPTPLQRLLELQRLDDALTTTDRRQQEIPRQILRGETALQGAREKHAAQKQALQDATLRQRAMEKALQASTEQIKRKQARQFEVKTNEEYKALLKEIAFAETEHARTEDELLALFDELDTLATSVRTQEASILRKEQETEQEKIRLEEESSRMQTMRDQLLLQRESLCLDLEASLIQNYERIRRNRQGQAVVVVRGDVCEGCHMGVPPQTVNEVLQTGEVRTCPHCLRILYCVLPDEGV